MLIYRTPVNLKSTLISHKLPFESVSYTLIAFVVHYVSHLDINRQHKNVIHQFTSDGLNTTNLNYLLIRMTLDTFDNVHLQNKNSLLSGLKHKQII